MKLLLIRAIDPPSGAERWAPVGGGIEPGETTHEAAAREAYEEAGLIGLAPGPVVWLRDHTYTWDGRVFDVHEQWLLCKVKTFDPVPAQLTASEARSVRGYRWWAAAEMAGSSRTFFPPDLGTHFEMLLANGAPAVPVDIGARG
ncbi:NUDIX domain-containing protein [Luteipulveratus halotolerans]|uniref:Nudix hydrolase domain-containing protein n=1 Tax=Luteipulveratus halotolerans TaxID=1631356 RepID=A0A0L6CLA3_9MICO|nr:NUDIX domain-containing protein [Luteipulveratus halotolerans]KNX38425.1 hypothetical protein VV01_16770 [Luteipulveratus halotolerans]